MEMSYEHVAVNRKNIPTQNCLYTAKAKMTFDYLQGTYSHDRFSDIFGLKIGIYVDVNVDNVGLTFKATPLYLKTASIYTILAANVYARNI